MKTINKLQHTDEFTHFVDLCYMRYSQQYSTSKLPPPLKKRPHTCMKVHTYRDTTITSTTTNRYERYASSAEKSDSHIEAYTDLFTHRMIIIYKQRRRCANNSCSFEFVQRPSAQKAIQTKIISWPCSMHKYMGLTAEVKTFPTVRVCPARRTLHQCLDGRIWREYRHVSHLVW